LKENQPEAYPSLKADPSKKPPSRSELIRLSDHAQIDRTGAGMESPPMPEKPSAVAIGR
jgi:hypothetical protein